MVTVAVLEDDKALRSALDRALRQAGHQTTVAATGAEAMRGFVAANPDVIILDLGLPDADGRDVCLALRSAGVVAPILMLTALDGLHHKVSGFAAGADDYLTKPFEVAELLARVDALARRRAVPQDTANVVLDPALHALSSPTAMAALTPTEYRLLARLMSEPGSVVRRPALVAAAWPMGAHVSDNTLDSYIRRLRTKLATVTGGHTIRTARGVGYAWE